jgi:hypothetical protein
MRGAGIGYGANQTKSMDIEGETIRLCSTTKLGFLFSTPARSDRPVAPHLILSPYCLLFFPPAHSPLQRLQRGWPWGVERVNCVLQVEER